MEIFRLTLSSGKACQKYMEKNDYLLNIKELAKIPDDFTYNF